MQRNLLMTLVAFVLMVVIVIRRLIFGDPVAGWASTICVIIFIGGVQLFCLGIMGQYIAKTYMETKHRPHFIIAETNRDDVKKIVVKKINEICFYYLLLCGIIKRQKGRKLFPVGLRGTGHLNTLESGAITGMCREMMEHRILEPTLKKLGSEVKSLLNPSWFMMVYVDGSDQIRVDMG